MPIGPQPFRPAPFQKHPDYQNRLDRIAALLDAGHSQREIAQAIGLSKQRVQQLIKLLPSCSGRGRESGTNT